MQTEEQTNELSPDEIEKLRLEREVQKRLFINRGLAFWVYKKSIFKYLPWGDTDKPKTIIEGSNEDLINSIKYRKVRTFTIRKPYLSVMDLMAEIKLSVTINIAELEKGDPTRYKNKVIRENTKLMGKLVAYSVLNNVTYIKLFGGLLGRYFTNHLDSEKLYNLCQLIDISEDAINFINSTVLIAGSHRTTEPKAEKIEENPTKAGVQQ